jgi:hypothetical protein
MRLITVDLDHTLQFAVAHYHALLAFEPGEQSLETVVGCGEGLAVDL